MLNSFHVKLISLVICITQVGCALRGPSSASSNPVTTAPQSTEERYTQEIAESGDLPLTDNVTQFRLNEDDKIEKPEELEPIPVEINPLVEKWIGYFQGRGRRHMERYLARSTRYEKLMKKVLRDSGLPEDLFYIALIESGFTSHATSHASAVGYWQFIRGTGKRYGLEISRLVDERRDPVLATQAAADYFKGLYSLFGSWYLAMASYNVGENRVKREVMKNSTRDFWELVRKKRLPSETMNYVPKFIAAKIIAKDPDKYGFDGIDYMPPIEFETITLKESINLRAMADKMNVPYEDFKAFNPKFKGEIAPAKNASLDLRVPVGMTDAGLQAAASSVAEQVVFVADAGDTSTYRVRSGDNLSIIAKKYRTNIAYLREINDMPRKSLLKVGQRLIVPDRTPLKDRRGSVAAKRTRQVPVSQVTGGEVIEKGYRFYVVQSGDSLYSIAQRYNTSIEQLKKINRLRKGRLIRVGLKLKLPGEVSNGSERKDSSKKSNKRKVHVVKRGESLLEIANRYDVTLSQIKSKNKIKNGSKILAGEKILIPAKNSL